MLDVLHIALLIALLAVVATLFTGFYALFRGGRFGRSWSNRLMRLRVALQFVAILILAAAFWLGRGQH
ncbi:MAG TPA: twin transmembrane helix small protein [Caulobacteraceae bacterium]|jgi:hypothetical protein|nr:twin transmembrane helix small protein [Caulobacteraceae bacterium]